MSEHYRRGAPETGCGIMLIVISILLVAGVVVGLAVLR